MNELIRSEIDEAAGIARVILSRPERRNALSAALVEELKDTLALAEADDRIRVVALAGDGPDFCAGADLDELQETIREGPLASLAEAESQGDLFILLRRLEKPIVAVVQGRALAGGCGLATACDLVVASADARFGYPEVKLGFVPAMVMAMLRRAVGEKRAFEMVTTGAIIDAQTAADFGLVNRVFPSGEFEAGVDSYLRDLAANSASSMALSKRLLYQTDGISFEAAVRAGAQVNVVSRMTDDCGEGVRRFLDRKK
jgi:methylglutaconyl-CoA hydratase